MTQKHATGKPTIHMLAKLLKEFLLLWINKKLVNTHCNLLYVIQKMRGWEASYAKMFHGEH